MFKATVTIMGTTKATKVVFIRKVGTKVTKDSISTKVTKEDTSGSTENTVNM